MTTPAEPQSTPPTAEDLRSVIDDLQPDPATGTRGIVSCLDAVGGLLVAVAATAPAERRRWHPYGTPAGRDRSDTRDTWAALALGLLRPRGVRAAPAAPRGIPRHTGVPEDSR